MKFEFIIEAFVAGLYAYAAAGLVFALAFAARGVARLDEQARGTGWGFRMMIIPGSIALWPLLLKRWRRATSSSGETK